MKKQSKNPLTSKHRKETFLKIYKANAGAIPATCEKVGITRKTYHQWYNKDEKFRDDVETINDNLLDMAQNVIKKSLEDGSLQAAMFVVKMRGKKRGWSEGIDITSNGEKINIKFDFGLDKENETKE